MSYTAALNEIPIKRNWTSHGIENNWGNEDTPYTTIKLRKLLHTLSKKALVAIEKIHSFSQLEENWDSYGATKPSKVAIDNAIKFIKYADEDGLEVYFTAPNVNGEILVEYKFSNNIASEIYFDGNGNSELLIYENTDCIVEGNVENSYYKLLKYV